MVQGTGADEVAHIYSEAGDFPPPRISADGYGITELVNAQGEESADTQDPQDSDSKTFHAPSPGPTRQTRR
jgi:hypothetical protein